MRDCNLAPTGGTVLFQWLEREDAATLHEFLAARGILIRLFARPCSLRFGLPPDAASWSRLGQALIDYSKERP
ncbi:threonine-phosphate decarboxylase [compost metagenome]